MRSSGPKRATPPPPFDDADEPFLSGDDDEAGELGARGGADERAFSGDCAGARACESSCGRLRDEVDAPGPLPGCSMLLNQPPMRLATLLLGLSGTTGAPSDDDGRALELDGNAELVGVTPHDDDRSSRDAEPPELGCA